MTTDQNGDMPKRQQPKWRHAKTATHPKRQQPKWCMSPFWLRKFWLYPKRWHTNGDTLYPKRRHIQNGDNQDGDNQNGACRRFGCEGFGCIQSGDTLKRPQPRRPQPKRCMSPFWQCRRFGFVTFLNTSQQGVLERHQVGCAAVLVCRRFDRYPFRIQFNKSFWREIKLDVSPFWLLPFWFVAVLTGTHLGYKLTQRFGEKSSWICRRFGVSPFWRVTVLDTSKHSVLERNQVGFVTVLACRLFLVLSPFWICCCFGVMPFWICRRFGNNQIGDIPKWRGMLPFWRVAILVVAVFGCVADLVAAVLVCHRFDRYPPLIIHNSTPSPFYAIHENCIANIWPVHSSISKRRHSTSRIWNVSCSFI